METIHEDIKQVKIGVILKNEGLPRHLNDTLPRVVDLEKIQGSEDLGYIAHLIPFSEFIKDHPSLEGKVRKLYSKIRCSFKLREEINNDKEIKKIMKEPSFRNIETSTLRTESLSSKDVESFPLISKTFTGVEDEKMMVFDCSSADIIEVIVGNLDEVISVDVEKVQEICRFISTSHCLGMYNKVRVEGKLDMLKSLLTTSAAFSDRKALENIRIYGEGFKVKEDESEESRESDISEVLAKRLRILGTRTYETCRSYIPLKKEIAENIVGIYKICMEHKHIKGMHSLIKTFNFSIFLQPYLPLMSAVIWENIDHAYDKRLAPLAYDDQPLIKVELSAIAKEEDVTFCSPFILSFHPQGDLCSEETLPRENGSKYNDDRRDVFSDKINDIFMRGEICQGGNLDIRTWAIHDINDVNVRLRNYVGFYLDDLDLKKSYITGSSISAAFVRYGPRPPWTSMISKRSILTYIQNLTISILIDVFSRRY